MWRYRWMVVSTLLVMGFSIFAQVRSNDLAMKRIYLYTTVIFMDDLERDWRRATGVIDAQMPAVIGHWQAFHQERIGYAKDFTDYQSSSKQFLEQMLTQFTPEQQAELRKRQLLHANSKAGQILLYEMVYWEHPLGGYAILPYTQSLPTRMALAMGSLSMGESIIKDEPIWSEYFALWSQVIRQYYPRFERLLQQHIEEYNQSLQTSKKSS
ncbi:hypothetical protein PVA45_08205 (plasmid) [Entomospira entomophila]|uniref:Uncharacterized protein n=1 Tax=Entomospira entomophila TaxID=2719988 RepID=A0A968KS64_9SPIO|nr:hypothetical protein [Entomospira entomophilus]NIZ41488.1 hypothetical protein [Entomospira entomophilus]WDI36322.1 hypothetical protein PVA45_08205 [Entomospira entomophilus]